MLHWSWQVQHRHYLVRTTQKYAETKRIPVDNQIHINYIHPVTGQWEVRRHTARRTSPSLPTYTQTRE